MWDCFGQLTMAVSDTSTTGEVLANRAAAIKAGYSHYSAARLEATFKIKYPEPIIRKSNQVKDAAQGGRVWTAPFLNYKLFKGDMEQSILSDFSANLAANMAQQQATIDHLDRVTLQ